MRNTLRFCSWITSDECGFRDFRLNYRRLLPLRIVRLGYSPRHYLWIIRQYSGKNLKIHVNAELLKYSKWQDALRLELSLETFCSLKLAVFNRGSSVKGWNVSQSIAYNRNPQSFQGSSPLAALERPPSGAWGSSANCESLNDWWYEERRSSEERGATDASTWSCKDDGHRHGRRCMAV